VVDWVAEDRARDAGDILAFGSRTMWNGLLKPEVLDVGVARLVHSESVEPDRHGERRMKVGDARLESLVGCGQQACWADDPVLTRHARHVSNGPVT